MVSLSDPVEGARTKSKRVPVAALSLGFFLAQLDVTIVNLALPELGSSLGAGTPALQWIIDAYTLAVAVLMPSAGVLSDRLGSRRSYLLGLSLFAAGSLFCACAPSAGFLIGARAVQGTAAALLVPSSLALLSRACGADASLLSRSVGLWTSIGCIGMAAGPLIGGFLLSLGGWRGIFLVNLPIAALAVFRVACRIPADERPEAARSFDIAGQILIIAALTGLTTAIIEAPRLGTASPLVLCGFALALLAGSGFAAVEARSALPMVPLGIFRSVGFGRAVIFGTTANFTYYGLLFVLSLYLQQEGHLSPGGAGLALLPMTGTFVFSNVVSVFVMRRWGLTRAMAIGGVIGGLGYALLAGLSARSLPIWVLTPAFILIPGGMGIGIPAATSLVLGSVDRALSGTASAVLNAARQTGGVLGVAAFGAIGAAGTELGAPLRTAAIVSAALFIVAGLYAGARTPEPADS